MTTRNIIIGLVIVVLIVVGYEWYVHSGPHGAFGSGDVTAADPSTPSPSSSNSDIDGKPLGTVGPTPSRSDAPGTINGEPVPGATTNQPPAPAKPTVSYTQPAPAPNNTAQPANLPASDTISRNPPNGLAFGGAGKFQWYREGDITWRVNTETGAACIAFATMDEWSKPIVYTHGCGNS